MRRESRLNAYLYAMIETALDYRPTPAIRSVFVCPPGMYRDEYVVFPTGPEEKVHGVNIASICSRAGDPPQELP